MNLERDGCGADLIFCSALVYEQVIMRGINRLPRIKTLLE